MSYDSKEDTEKHIETVRYFIDLIISELSHRKTKHDQSKLSVHEKPIFDNYTPKLKNSTYGSDEYKEFLKEMKVALDHHYKSNRHHPEHFENGIKDMNLIDIIEMFCDWKAATLRHDDGDIKKSVVINKERFGYTEELERLFNNTIKIFERGT